MQNMNTNEKTTKEGIVLNVSEMPQENISVGKGQNYLLVGDNAIWLKKIPDNSIDSIVTDPPAGISFMAHGWDSDKGGRDNWIKWMQEVATECKRVLKPGGHAFVWAIPRTSHWTATAWENAGFEIRDVVAHVFGSGFPKSHNIGKAVEATLKLGGSSPKHLRQSRMGEDYKPTGQKDYKKGRMFSSDIEQDNREEVITNKWQGWGTALKPAREDWILMRKPLEKGLNIAQNCLKWGTGGINIDECRIPSTGEELERNNHTKPYGGMTINESNTPAQNNVGIANSKRFPANVIHDGSEEVRECFPNESERFFKSIIYQAKASKKDRGQGNNHPTVKPLKLMEYLIKMVTPNGGVVLDPFAGSGTTGVACKNLGRNYILIEKEPEYIDIINQRLTKE